MHIAATEVERPGDVVEGRNKHAVGVLLAQGFTDAAQLRRRFLTGILQRMNLHGIHGDGGAVVPDEAQRVVVGAQRQSALLAQVGDELFDEGCRVSHSVGSDLLRSAVAEFLTKPFGNRWRAGHLQLHQLELRAPQLFFCCEEVTGVGPEGGTRHRDNSRACRTVETTDPLASFPMVGHVFAVMRVGTSEDVGSQAFALHLRAQRLNSFVDSHILY